MKIRNPFSMTENGFLTYSTTCRADILNNDEQTHTPRILLGPDTEIDQNRQERFGDQKYRAAQSVSAATSRHGNVRGVLRILRSGWRRVALSGMSRNSSQATIVARRSFTTRIDFSEWRGLRVLHPRQRHRTSCNERDRQVRRSWVRKETRAPPQIWKGDSGPGRFRASDLPGLERCQSLFRGWHFYFEVM